MLAFREADRCLFCKIGSIVRTDQEIAFKQHTKKGYVLCCVAIIVDTCDLCGLKSWDHNSEELIENAVQHEYEKLSQAEHHRMA